MLTLLDNPAIFAKEVVEHHLSFQKLIKEPVTTVQEVLLIKTILDTNNILIYEITYNLVNIITNILFSKLIIFYNYF